MFPKHILKKIIKFCTVVKKINLKDCFVHINADDGPANLFIIGYNKTIVAYLTCTYFFYQFCGSGSA